MLTRDLLHDYQNNAVEFIKRKRYCALWALMGAGKTATSLTAIADLIYDLEVNRVLIIAPLRVCQSTWPKELASWLQSHHLTVSLACGSECDTAKKRLAAANRDTDVTIINRENVEWLVENFPEKKWRWDMVVIDESSSFKSHQANRWKALRRVRGQIRRMVQLTGTPSPNGLHDIWAQIYLLDGGARLGKNITAFRRRWFERSFDGHDYEAKSHAQAEIEQLIADLVMVVETYEGLPETVTNPIEITMPPALAKQYRDFKRESVLELPAGDITAMSAGVLANKLLQFAGGHCFDENREVHHIHSLKIEALKELVDTQGRNMLVAYNYQHELASLKKAFPKAVVLDKDPRTIDRWNAGKISMLLAHPASAGHGLNLQKGGRDVVWYGLPWSLELYQQFNARLARQGQEGVVFLHHLVLLGTIDEYVMEVLKTKAATQDALIAAVKRIATES